MLHNVTEPQAELTLSSVVPKFKNELFRSGFVMFGPFKCQ